MENSLKTIQLLAKIGKVISMIVFVCSIIGIVGCVLGMGALIAVKDLEIQGKSLSFIIRRESGLSLTDVYFACTLGVMACIGESVVAKCAVKYFNNELAAGTPFTFEGAQEIKRLGILSIAITVSIAIVKELAYVIFQAFDKVDKEIFEGTQVSVDMGVALLVMSLIFKYGAELKNKK